MVESMRQQGFAVCMVKKEQKRRIQKPDSGSAQIMSNLIAAGPVVLL
jgi:hypothetical protein